MTPRRFASSARARQVVKSAKPLPDSRIDFSDIPESTDAELKRARRVGRPKTGSAKQLIAIRISAPARRASPAGRQTVEALPDSDPRTPRAGYEDRSLGTKGPA